VHESLGFGFDLEILFVARRLGLVVREVPIRWRDDARSTVRPLTDGLRVLAEVGKILVAWMAGRYRR
jgi:dolichyl-phosphate beta-glucosyltransferase